MNKRFCVALSTGIICAVLSGCGLTSDGEPMKKEVLIPKLKAQITAQLKDPASAQFRNEVFYQNIFVTKDGKKHPAEAAICGEINAKNSFGAYTGFRRFVSSALVTPEGDNFNMQYQEGFVHAIEGDNDGSTFQHIVDISCLNTTKHEE